MKKFFNKKEILTIPNMLSILRIALLPLIVWLYCVKKNYHFAIFILLLSGITDIVDGFIARRFDMISDFGKILDPFADKLTQGTLLLCLASKYRYIFALVGLFALKEIIMIIIGYILIKQKNSVNSAKWYGKLNTVIIYSVIVILIIIPDIPLNVVNIMIYGCAIAIIGSFLLYLRFYRGILISKEENTKMKR